VFDTFKLTKKSDLIGMALSWHATAI